MANSKRVEFFIKLIKSIDSCHNRLDTLNVRLTIAILTSTVAIGCSVLTMLYVLSHI